MINEFDTKEKRTENFKKAKQILSENLSICDIVNVVNDIRTVVFSIDGIEEKIVDSVNDALLPMIKIRDKCITYHCCQKCGNMLYLSDLPQYDFVCPDCDENFMKIEVK